MALTYIAAQKVFDRIDETHKAYWGSRPGHPLSALDRLAREYQFGQSIGQPVPTKFAYDDKLGVKTAGRYTTPEGFRWFYPDNDSRKPYVEKPSKADLVRINKAEEKKEGELGGRIAIHELRHKAMQILRDNPGVWKDITYKHGGKDKKLINYLMPKGRWSTDAEHDLVYAYSPFPELTKKVGRRDKVDDYTKEKLFEAVSAAKAANKATSLIPTEEWDYLEGLLEVSPTKEDRLSEEQWRKKNL